MAIRVALRHLTEYRYDRRVTLQPHVVRLRPAPHCRTPILAYSLRVEPERHFLHWQQDPHGNHLARLTFDQASDRLRVEVDLIAELSPLNPFDFFLDESAERSPFVYDAAQGRELAPFLAREEAGPLLAELVRAERRADLRSVDYLVGLNGAVQRRVRYLIRMEPGVQSCEETLAQGSGSCRDSAWLLVQLLRHLGLAARFVSGYLIQLKSDRPVLDGPAGPPEDFTDLHAWAEVFLPGAGWVGLDPTSGLFAGEGHLPLACGADPVTASPVSGTFTFTRLPGEAADASCGEDLHFRLSVARLEEAPPPSRPYSEEEWSAIDALGLRVDQDLERLDARLTFGGEPTFVSEYYREAPEWNIEALGEEKRRQADALLVRLRERLAPGGLLHHGQGKWYPGEPLPRWALGCYWRLDGEPVWRDVTLLAAARRNLGHGIEEARRFVEALAGRLGVERGRAIPAHEDAWYYLWRERRLPANVDPFESRLEEPIERERLARIFEQGLASAVGFALPLWREDEAGGRRWISGPWFLRRERMLLLPGDSPMGYRLPLDSLPWEAPHEARAVIERDPFVARGPLPPAAPVQVSNLGSNGVVVGGACSAVPVTRQAGETTGGEIGGACFVMPFTRQAGETTGGEIGGACFVMPFTRQAGETTGGEIGGACSAVPVTRQAGETTGGELGGACFVMPFTRQAGETHQDPTEQVPPTGRAPGSDPSRVVRTVLCVEPREGVLRVFLPPVPLVEDFLELVARIEETAAELSLPVVVEGYPPPFDPRLRHFHLTPDPGVLEVNLPAARCWPELRDLTTVLYDEARRVGLTAEKFLLDGRPVGTGGGSHVVLGGPTPADSPLLRRPDLLRSLLVYWQNHPALSYFFTGLFVGPSSQSPRVDEGRGESLYELELALSRFPEVGQPAPPWLVDRLLRHLLTDVTGNTHRAEFCMDKLHSPDGPSGRRGLLELRSFEMAPHERTSLAQQLLVRGLVAAFWRAPCLRRPVRFGADLQDRFLLPHFLWQDLVEVLEDLRRWGYPFEDQWFAAHRERRFPIIGAVACRGVQIELRPALEPWPALGEEPGAGGTARFVDSSVERLEVKARGLTEGRYVVVCNGRRVPLQPTGAAGEWVAGVRFRAWQPPSCLHPNIPVNSPLVFDLVDRWRGRSIGGCTYYVSHPGGLAFEKLPVNEREAESRWRARFFPFGHTPGKQSDLPEEPPREYPFTLDLRQLSPRSRREESS